MQALRTFPWSRCRTVFVCATPVGQPFFLDHYDEGTSQFQSGVDAGRHSVHESRIRFLTLCKCMVEKVKPPRLSKEWKAEFYVICAVVSPTCNLA